METTNEKKEKKVSGKSLCVRHQMKADTNGEKTMICEACQKRAFCTEICPAVESIIPSMEAGRVDAEDIPRIMEGRSYVNTLLSNVNLLTQHQRIVVRQYYREGLQQEEIARLSGVSQQAIADCINKARARIGKKMKKN